MNILFLGNFGVPFSSESHHAASLESLGHQVIRRQEGKTSVDEIMGLSKDADLFIWVHTHGWETPGDLYHFDFMGCPIIGYHLDLWMGLDRQQDLKNDPYWLHLDHFFTADRLMADYLNQNTSINAHYLPAGVYDKECYIAEGTVSPYANDVVFVGSYGYHPEWPYRPKLIDWLHDTYGYRFTHVGGGGMVNTLRGDDLNKLYANSKVVVGDSLCQNFDYPDYWSDRVYETLGRGGFLIHPRIAGMERHFTHGEHLVLYTYDDFDELKTMIDGALDNPLHREEIRLKGHEHVKNNHTYVHRWQHILKELDL